MFQIADTFNQVQPYKPEKIYIQTELMFTFTERDAPSQKVDTQRPHTEFDDS